MESFFMNDPASSVTSSRILYTPSTFARTSLLHLQEIGSLTALREHTSDRDGLRSFLFLVVRKGSGKLIYNGREYRLAAGACAFIDCRKPYAHTTSADLWTLSWCHFYGPTMTSLYEKYVERGGKTAFFPPDTAPFLSTLDRLNKAAGSGDYIRDMKINEELSRLCTLLMAESWHPEASLPYPAKRQSVTEVKEYLDRHYAERITLDQLSNRFFINKYYLSRMFKEQFGLPVIAYLLEVRITHAKQMLRFTDRSVEEIGMECGLGALHYFSRVFKSVEGVPPSLYRSQWRK